MPQQMKINRPLAHRQPQPRHHHILQLLPHILGIGFACLSVSEVGFSGVAFARVAFAGVPFGEIGLVGIGLVGIGTVEAGVAAAAALRLVFHVGVLGVSS